MNKVIKDIIMKLMFYTQKNFMNFIMPYHFYQKKENRKKLEKFVTNLYVKNEYVIHIRKLKQAVKPGTNFE